MTVLQVHQHWRYDEPRIEVDGVQCAGCCSANDISFALNEYFRYKDTEAFYHSQKPQPFDDEAWKARREEVMMRGLRLKFAACADARALLTSTWPHPLLSIKCDTFWGFDPVSGGSNALAKLLMQLRDELMAASAATPARCIVLNGIVYKSLADHDPHSTSAIDERGKLYNLDPPWQLCPKTADALHVCATYPWASHALVFADGSAHYTALPQTLPGYPGSPYEPGAQANPGISFSGLRQQGGQYGTARDGCFDCGIPSHCGCIRRLDVLIMRNL